MTPIHRPSVALTHALACALALSPQLSAASQHGHDDSASDGSGSKQPPSLVVTTGNSFSTIGASFVNGGRNFATWNGAEAIVWTLEGDEVRRINIADGYIVEVANRHLVAVHKSAYGIYRLDTGELERKIDTAFREQLGDVSLLSDERTLVYAADGTVVIRDLLANAVRRSFKCAAAKVRMLASPSGDVFITYGTRSRPGWSNLAAVRSAESGAGTFPQNSGLSAGESPSTMGGTGRTRPADDPNLARYADTTEGLQGAEAGDPAETTIQVWDLESGKKKDELSGHRASIRDAVYSPDGRFLASGSDDGTVRVWDLGTGKSVQTLKPYGDMPDAKLFRLPPVLRVAFSPDGRSIATVSGVEKWPGYGIVRVWQIQSGLAETLRITQYPQSYLCFSPDGTKVACNANSYFGGVELVNVADREMATRFSSRAISYGKVSFNPSGTTVHVQQAEGFGVLQAPAVSWNIASGKEEFRIAGPPAKDTYSVPFIADTGALFGTQSYRKERKTDAVEALEIVDRATQRPLWRATDRYFQMFSPDGKYVLTASPKERAFDLVDAETGHAMRKLEGSRSKQEWAFSPNSRLITASLGSLGFPPGRESEAITVWDTQTAARVRDIKLGHRTFARGLAISPDNRTVAAILTQFERYGEYGFRLEKSAAVLFNVDTGEQIVEITTPFTFGGACAFSPDGRHVLIPDPGDLNSVALAEVPSGRIVRSFRGHRSSVTSASFSPDGRTLATASGDGTVRLWRVDSGEELCQLITFRNNSWLVVTREGRFDTNDFSSTRGLGWVRPEAPMELLPFELFMREYYEPQLLARILAGEKLPPVQSVSDRNLLQPRVAITRVFRAGEQSDRVNVEVEVESVREAGQGGATAGESGVVDVRLFRDDQLVGSAPRGGGSVSLDPVTRRAKILFEDVALPIVAGASRVTFSAYAFNADMVKSPTDTKMIELAGDGREVKRRAYVIGIGVSANEMAPLELRFAARDAVTTVDAVSSRLNSTGTFADVVPVLLTSERAGGGSSLAANGATKENIRAVFDLLAGRAVAPETVASIPNGALLRQARPEDLVFVSFAGHGYADDEGRYYLVPYDMGEGAGAAAAGSERELELAEGSAPESDDLLARCISSDELASWFQDVDAGDIVLVVDACQSEATVASSGFKPGPLGSRGFGQLAYDKAMRVLAATQADNVAIESARLRAGLLTYVLVEEGLNAGLADHRPADGRVAIAEWLAFAVDRVPAIAEEVRSGKRQFIPLAPQTPRGDRRPQRPVLFDFVRRPQDISLGLSGARSTPNR